MTVLTCFESTAVYVGEWRVSLEGVPPEWNPHLDVLALEPGLDLLTLFLERPDCASPPEFSLQWHVPIFDGVGVWTALANKEKNLDPDWGHPFTAQLGVGAPVFCLFGADGSNRLTCAASDALNLLEIRKGVHEETAHLHCQITFMKENQAPLSRYAVEIRVDRRALPFSQTLGETATWWTQHYPVAPVPESAWQPVYSTWYTFHQELQDHAVEQQCRLARDLGCTTVIVDDGWQTTDNRRGYAYCGDWEVCEDRFADMAAHVAAVHALNMKYLLWYAVPFVGFQAKAFDRFQGHYLHHNENLQAAILDPRFPEVRDYLIDTYVHALRRWHLDGLKLDFIDQFALPPGTPDPALSDPGTRDFLSLPAAVNHLMLELRAQLTRLRPDVLIEFRQNYTGPAMRQYGNLFRAADCPSDMVANRIRTIDLRLLAPGGAIHSDMLMWHPEEPTEQAARQLLNVIFAVPQISVRLDALSRDHRAMLAFYLGYQQQHADVFLRGTLRPAAPELNYPWVVAETDSTTAIAVYQDALAIPITPRSNHLLIALNATATPELLFRFATPSGDAEVRLFDVRGQIVQKDRRPLAAFETLPVPISGGVEITFTP